MNRSPIMYSVHAIFCLLTDSHQQTVRATSPHSEWTLIYNRTSYLYSTTMQTVTVNVKKNEILVASASVHFELSAYVSGKILVQQHGEQTNLSTWIHDPYNWIKSHNTEIFVSWIINKKKVAICNTPSLLINFTKPGKYSIEANVYLETVHHATTTLNTIKQKLVPPSRRTLECDGWWPNNVSTEKGSVNVHVGYFFITIRIMWNTQTQSWLLSYYNYIIIILVTTIIFLSVYLFIKIYKRGY